MGEGVGGSSGRPEFLLDGTPFDVIEVMVKLMCLGETSLGRNQNESFFKFADLLEVKGKIKMVYYSGKLMVAWDNRSDHITMVAQEEGYRIHQVAAKACSKYFKVCGDT